MPAQARLRAQHLEQEQDVARQPRARRPRGKSNHDAIHLIERHLPDPHQLKRAARIGLDPVTQSPRRNPAGVALADYMRRVPIRLAQQRGKSGDSGRTHQPHHALALAGGKRLLDQTMMKRKHRIALLPGAIQHLAGPQPYQDTRCLAGPT
jgi:hypothetical protein